MKDETILDSVQVPDEFVDLCSRWYDGSGSMMYAVASTGNLSRGSIRPLVDAEDDHQDDYGRWHCVYRQATDLEWYRSLFSDLGSEVRWCIRALESGKPGLDDDIDEFRRFDAWLDDVLSRIDAEIESEATSAHN